MNILTNSNEISTNETSSTFTSTTLYLTRNNSSKDNSLEETIGFIQSSVAAVGIVTNLTVIVVFLYHKKLRRKLPYIFIINQVGTFYVEILVSSYRYILITSYHILSIKVIGSRSNE